jgi:hypothetical protein
MFPQRKTYWFLFIFYSPVCILAVRNAENRRSGRNSLFFVEETWQPRYKLVNKK